MRRILEKEHCLQKNYPADTIDEKDPGAWQVTGKKSSRTGMRSRSEYCRMSPSPLLIAPQHISVDEAADLMRHPDRALSAAVHNEVMGVLHGPHHDRGGKTINIACWFDRRGFVPASVP
jgi:hypothetical protein